LIDEITAIAGLILTMTIGIDVITAATTGAMTTVAMIATTGTTTDVMIDIARMTTVPATTTGRSGLHHHRPKGATPMVYSRRPTARSTS
jgi:hypothetical protein